MHGAVQFFKRGVWIQMPGPSSGVPMNSMPAVSSADWMTFRFGMVLLGTLSSTSIRFIVRTLTPLLFASASALNFSA